MSFLLEFKSGELGARRWSLETFGAWISISSSLGSHQPLFFKRYVLILMFSDVLNKFYGGRRELCMSFCMSCACEGLGTLCAFVCCLSCFWGFGLVLSPYVLVEVFIAC